MSLFFKSFWIILFLTKPLFSLKIQLSETQKKRFVSNNLKKESQQTRNFEGSSPTQLKKISKELVNKTIEIKKKMKENGRKLSLPKTKTITEKNIKPAAINPRKNKSANIRNQPISKIENDKKLNQKSTAPKKLKVVQKTQEFSQNQKFMSEKKLKESQTMKNTDPKIRNGKIDNLKSIPQKKIQIKQNDQRLNAKKQLISQIAVPERKLNDKFVQKKSRTEKNKKERKLHKDDVFDNDPTFESSDFLKMMQNRQAVFSKQNIDSVDQRRQQQNRFKNQRPARKLQKVVKIKSPVAKKKVQPELKKTLKIQKKEQKIKITPQKKSKKLLIKKNRKTLLTKKAQSNSIHIAKKAEVLSQAQPSVQQTPIVQQNPILPAENQVRVSSFQLNHSDEEEIKAQNFVNDLQSQVRQTKMAVENIQDKLIVIKENENEIKSMLSRILRDKNLIA